MDALLTVAVVVLVILAAVIVVQRVKYKNLVLQTEQSKKDLIEKEAILQKEAMIKAKEALHIEREQLNEDERERRREFAAIENKLSKREDILEDKIQEVSDKELELDKLKDQLIEKEDFLAEIVQKQTVELERIAGMSTEEAKRMLLEQLKSDLAQEQMQKKLKDGVEGENLNLLIGSIPYNDEKVSEKVKLNILNILNRKYGIVEKDFLSAELELVPAFKCRSLGFDESLIAGYGQDDKVSVYTSLTAILNIENPTKTAACLFVDKEEIGSMGNTGMESNVFSTFMSDVLNKLGVNRPNLLDKMFCNSRMLSADVDAGLDPIYASVADLHNASFLNKGVGISKYTGVAGKANGSDANAEFVAYVRGIFESNNVGYQIAELGRVDLGGGGTIAYILANKGVDVLDCGVPVLSMHAPYEVTSKYDVYQAYKGYEAFFRS